eukprot:TRINITY_DN694_c0_g1_i1.p1 TRINITY_DN694_c0_g1~~TRINITY_DN694_c0_g1_i1.p1  ORF type:complete len:209 (+),score=68.04 TRINITY_DN694_c0_g1_i1:31-627(+)
MKSNKEKIAKAEEYKISGNKFFQAQQYPKALDSYHRARLYLKGFPIKNAQSGNSIQDMIHSASGAPPSEEELKKIKELCVAVYSNMAACHLKQNKGEKAIQDCNDVLDLDPKNAKALYRRGQAHMLNQDVDRASADLNKALELSPNDAAVKAELVKLKKMEREQIQKQKKAFAGMFDKAAKEKEGSQEEKITNVMEQD